MCLRKGHAGTWGPGEIATLQLEHIRVKDLSKYTGRRMGVITIANPKTKRRGARFQHVTLDNVILLQLVERFLSQFADPETFVFPSYAAHSKHAKYYLDRLLGQGHGFSLAGLRGGGATFHYLKHRDILELARRGRWVSIKTLEHYVQISGASLDAQSWSVSTRQTLEDLAFGWEPLLHT